MAVKTWNFTLDNVHNVISLEKIPKRSIFLNTNGTNLMVPQSYKGPLGSTEKGYAFQLGTHQMFLSVQQGFFKQKFDLYCDGQNVETNGFYVPAAGMPTWNWIFVVLNAIIFLGLGLIPTMLSIGGVYGTMSVSRNDQFSLPMKVIICTGITLAMWIIMFIVSFAAISVRYNLYR